MLVVLVFEACTAGPSITNVSALDVIPSHTCVDEDDFNKNNPWWVDNTCSALRLHNQDATRKAQYIMYLRCECTLWGQAPLRS